MKKANTTIKNEREIMFDIHYNRIEDETVATGSLSCWACPYVVGGRHGECRCYKNDYKKCCEED